MAVLDDILAGQQADENQGLALAAHDASWANFFNDTPPAEKLRANLNLTNMVNDAVQQKQDLLAQDNLKAAELRATNAKFQEFQKQAPLREQLLQAHIDATGATEKRMAAQAVSKATDTAGLNSDIANAYQQGLKPGTAAFNNVVFSSIATHPNADQTHIGELHKLAGGPDDVDPVAFAMQGKAMQDAADTAGLKNARATTVGGKWTLVKGPETVSNEEKIADAVARIKAVEAARSAGKPKALSSDEKAAAYQDAIIGGTLAFGTPSSDGLSVKPNTANDAAGGVATHVTSFYQDPLTGKFVPSKPMTIEQFQAIQKSAAARKGATPAGSSPADVSVDIPNSEADSPSSHTPSGAEGPIKVTSPQQFHDLPSGTDFIDPQGVKRRKP